MITTRSGAVAVVVALAEACLATSASRVLAAQDAADGAATTAMAAQDENRDTTVEDEHLLMALRARVAGGVVLFNGRPRIVLDEAPVTDGARRTATVESPQFSQASSYLALEVQPRLLPSRCTGECETRGYPGWYLEPLLSVRLTTIPVVTGDVVAATVQEDDADASNSSHGDQGEPFLEVAKTLEPFTESQKTAQVQLGGVASVNFGGFRVGDSRFHWAVGVTGRVILQSITDAQRTLRVWDIDDDLYSAKTVGARLSLYGTKDDRRGWTPAAYVDISWGSFESYRVPTDYNSSVARRCVEAPRECLAAGRLPSMDDFTYHGADDERWYVEGRMFLNSIYLGLDINAGAGPDDVRFSAGVTLNVSDYFSRRSSGNPR